MKPPQLFSRIALLVVAVALCARVAASQDIVVHTERGHKGDLVSALAFISHTFRLPIIAELTKSYPPHVSILPGEHSAAELLNEITSQSPGYTWITQDGVVVFYRGELHEASGNFFNRHIARFVMPADLAQLKLELNQVMASAPGTAPVLVGVVERPLQSVKLSRGEVFHNLTGRQILIEAAKESRNLFSVVLFPTEHPTAQHEMAEAHTNWYIRSIDELRDNPIRLRSIPAQPSGP
jgi:hypothetical protein